jgi:pyrimidine operon attenuation protein/uracil phosphoribosyltransferase
VWKYRGTRKPHFRPAGQLILSCFTLRPPAGQSRPGMPEQHVLLNANALRKCLLRIAHEISERNDNSQEVALVGIQRGGVHLATRLAQNLKHIWQHDVPCGSIDASMHRDDLDAQPAPVIMPTSLPFDLNGRTVVLVDDVLFSGRTVRAALDALGDFGRPRRVQLAVLVDRGHRDLPIKADFIGKNTPTSLDEHIEVHLAEEEGNDVVYIGRK